MFIHGLQATNRLRVAVVDQCLSMYAKEYIIQALPNTLICMYVHIYIYIDVTSYTDPRRSGVAIGIIY